MIQIILLIILLTTIIQITPNNINKIKIKPQEVNFTITSTQTGLKIQRDSRQHLHTTKTNHKINKNLWT